MSRKSIFFLLTTILLGSALLLLSIFIYFKLHNGCEDEETCLTPECVQTAAKILSYLNTSVNPCENFYEFSCGTFLSTTEIPNNKDQISTESILQDELLKQVKEILESSTKEDEPEYAEIVKKYYRACNNIDAVEKRSLSLLQVILDETGGWPVLEGFNWNEKIFNWYQYVYRLRNFGVVTNFFLKITVSPDKSDRSNAAYIIQVDAADVSILENPLLQSSLNGKFFYHKFMVSIAKYFGANESRAVYELAQSLEFEINLAHISAIKDAEPLYLTIMELEKQFPGIPWFDYFNNFVSQQFLITRDERIKIIAPRYLRNLIFLLNKTPARIQANYIMWKAIYSLIPYLNNDLREREFAYRNAVNRYTEKESRWMECITETYHRLPLLTSSMYIQSHFDQETQTRATILYQSIKKEYLNSIETIDWMDDTTRKRIMEKISKTTHSIGYSDEIQHTKLLNSLYNSLEINSEDYLSSYFNIRLFEHNLSIKKLRESFIIDDWEDSRFITDTRVFYNQHNNHLWLPAGALQGLFFNKRLPNYLNYGGIGVKTAKEITQIFDTELHNWDNILNQRQMWTENSYLEKIQCFFRQYEKHITKEVYEPINETTSIVKSIADNIGLKVAYVAYQRLIEDHGKEKKLTALNYTPNQLFWISYAISQCSKEKTTYLKSFLSEYGDIPTEFRVTESLSNLEYFSNDFQCDFDSLMNPTVKCIII